MGVIYSQKKNISSYVEYQARKKIISIGHSVQRLRAKLVFGSTCVVALSEVLKFKIKGAALAAPQASLGLHGEQLL